MMDKSEKYADINADKLRKMFYYNQETGAFYRRLNDLCMLCSSTSDGYITVTINRKSYSAHILAFIYMENYRPEQVDHIDQNRSNNAWRNLRASTLIQNRRNKTLYRNNTSGFCGVRKHHTNGKWVARIKVDGKTIMLGHFDKIEDAAAARESANKIYGFYENHGKPSIYQDN